MPRRYATYDPEFTKDYTRLSTYGALLLLAFRIVGCPGGVCCIRCSVARKLASQPLGRCDAGMALHESSTVL